MSEIEVAPGKSIEFSQSAPGRETGRSVRMKIADIIYVLDIQNKNKHIDRVLARYGVEEAALDRIKSELVKGQWKVVRN